MKRNGLVLVPREPPKRVILYPTQESANQQQQFNGFANRPKTAVVTNNETTSQTSSNIRFSRQQPLSTSSNGTLKLDEKIGKIGSRFFFYFFPVFLDHDGTVPNTFG